MAALVKLPTTSISHPSSSSTYLRRRSNLTLCCTNRNGANFLVPPVNPKCRSMPLMNTENLFLPKLASLPEVFPKKQHRPSFSDQLSVLNSFDSPTAITAAPAVVGRSARYEHVRKKHTPPDLPSQFLDQRIVNIDMPFVPMFTELVIAQLMYLEMKDPDEPITLHINSTGTTLDGETVASETEGFAIYDVLMQLRCEEIRERGILHPRKGSSPRNLTVRTIALGDAIGGACLLLAAGTKGKRGMFPHATVMIHQPKIAPTGLMPSSDVNTHVKEVLTAKDTLVRLLAKHTGQSVETITKDIRTPFYLDCEKAKEYGVIDKIMWRGQENKKKNASPGCPDENAVRSFS